MTVTEVIAKTVGDIHITFECPFCWSKYKKDGQPYKNAKKLIHTHGSCGEKHNRNEYRIHHCFSKIYDGEFKIIINDDTKRV